MTKSLDQMTLPELRREATIRGIVHLATATDKANIIAILRKSIRGAKAPKSAR